MSVRLFQSILICTLALFTNSKPIICTESSPTQYFRIPKLPKCNYVLKNKTEVVKYEVFKPNIIEYISNAHLCKKLVSEVSMYTDFSGYEHLIEKELNDKTLTITECKEMINNKKCDYGTLVKNSDVEWFTNNKITIDYPNRFTSLFSPKRYLKENCIIIETKVYSHFNQKRPTNIMSDMSKCDYLTGSCEVKNNEVMIWDVNRDQNCKYVSIGKLNGFYNNGLWINKENQIALSFANKSDSVINDCGNSLALSDEGFAVKKVVIKKPRSTLKDELNSEMTERKHGLNLEHISKNPKMYEKERQEYYERQRNQQEEIQKYQEELKKRNEATDKRMQEEDNQIKLQKEQREQRNRWTKSQREKYEMELKEFERKREEKLKRYQEFERRKQEKILRQQRERNNTTNRTKREITNLDQPWQPLPLPSYDEYLKIKHDCDVLPTYAEFMKIRESCNTFTSYTDFINRIAKYEIDKRQSESTLGQDRQRMLIRSIESNVAYKAKGSVINRTKRDTYSDFQAAGEFQYLENIENNQLRHTTEIMCSIFNDHNDLLEMMIKENPRGYMQKQLNHSAIRVNVIPDTDNIVEVTFCKEIDVENIENLDLKDFDGYEFDSALTHGQVPIKIRGFGDKIWYFKDNIISSKISSSWNNKTIGVLDVKEYNLKFLDDKIIFHEHILFDTKTNIEEDLINEMREKSEVALTLHANEQNSMIPHEILDDVESFFEKYYLRFWRIYVTIGVTLFYIFIIRSFWMVLSPKLSISKRKRNNSSYRRNKDGLELQQLNHHTSHRSLVVD